MSPGDFLPLGDHPTRKIAQGPRPAHSSRGKKLSGLTSSAALRPASGCGVGRLRSVDRHRGRDGRGLENSEQGELPWRTSAPSRSPAPSYLGEIVTLSVQTKNVRIVPEATRASDNAPSHRIFVGRAEIGAAWSKRSAENRDYLSVKLDDPSFNAPIYANLFDDEDGDGFTLIWSRGRKANGD